MKAIWNGMAGLRLVLNLFPDATWRLGLRAGGFPDNAITTWVAAELSRGSGRDIAEAGRELGRYDSRPWIESLQDLPSAVVVTERDTSVPPRKQKELAASLGAPVFGVDADHAAVTVKHREFNAALLEAVSAVGARAGAAAEAFRPRRRRKPGADLTGCGSAPRAWRHHGQTEAEHDDPARLGARRRPPRDGGVAVAVRAGDPTRARRWPDDTAAPARRRLGPGHRRRDL